MSESAAPPPERCPRCPRCGTAFHCGMNDAAPCACTGPKLDATLQQALRQRYRGCLCLRCLHALAGGAALELPSGAPRA